MFELAEARRLKVNVRLCPHIDGSYCLMESDKESIHKEILSQLERRFEKINSSVKRIRLDYLLDYPAHKIQSNAFIRDLR